MIDIPLITKYRPTSFTEVVGHDEAIAALNRALLSSTRPHAYLLTGPAGVGKTTIARIIAAELDAELHEIAAAEFSGVDAMRELVTMGQHQSLNGAGRRLFLLDEAHALSKPAWQVLLKIIEEPPDHLYFCLATTERNKVPETIVSRCYHVVLRALRAQEMELLIDTIAELEGWKVKGDVLSAILTESTGQPRKALTMLQTVHDAVDRSEVQRITALMDGGDDLIELCRLLIKGRASTWENVRVILARIDDDQMASAAELAGRFFMSAFLRSTNAEEAKRIYDLMEALCAPSETYDRKLAFTLAIGRIMFA